MAAYLVLFPAIIHLLTFLDACGNTVIIRTFTINDFLNFIVKPDEHP